MVNVPAYLTDFARPVRHPRAARGGADRRPRPGPGRHLAVPAVADRRRGVRRFRRTRLRRLGAGTGCRCRRAGRCTGTAGPAYTNVVYPFPVDPPHVPDENPTGDHRRRASTCRRPGPGPGRCCASTASTRAPGSGSTAPSSAVTQGSRLPAEFDVTGRAASRRVQRARRAGAPVVGRQLPGGPGHVVAAGHLPRRHACGCGRPAASTTSSCAPTTTIAAAPARCGSTAPPGASIDAPELGLAGVSAGTPHTVGEVSAVDRRDPFPVRRDDRVPTPKRYACGSASGRWPSWTGS